jgi:DNA end-binding protein Ku
MPATVWKGHISFGLVSVPVRLHRAARKATTRLHHVRYTPPEEDEGIADAGTEPAPDVPPPTRQEPAPAPAAAASEPPSSVARLQQRFVAEDENEPVPPAERAKAYEYEPDQYVVLRNQEIAHLRPATSPDMEILNCVRLAEIDPVYLETSYYVVPEPAGERPYALLYSALHRAGYAALGKVAMHGREHIMIVRAGRRGLLAHTMFYNDEVRAEYEFDARSVPVDPKELDLATQVVRALAAPFQPEQYRDEYRERLQALIEAKASQRQTLPAVQQRQPRAPVIDIMDALKRSLELARKPVQPEKAPERKTRSRRRA